MHRTRDELLGAMSAREILWWVAADDLGLLPDPIAESARLRATLFNIAAGKPIVDPIDLLPEAYRGAAAIPAATEAEHLAACTVQVKSYFASLRAHAAKVNA